MLLISRGISNTKQNATGAESQLQEARSTACGLSFCMLDPVRHAPSLHNSLGASTHQDPRCEHSLQACLLDKIVIAVEGSISEWSPAQVIMPIHFLGIHIRVCQQGLCQHTHVRQLPLKRAKKQ